MSLQKVKEEKAKFRRMIRKANTIEEMEKLYEQTKVSDQERKFIIDNTSTEQVQMVTASLQ